MDLWKHLNQITAFLKKNPVKILMLDFDGTLTPIIGYPPNAKLSIETKNLLQKLSKKHNLFLAIISGRELVFIKKRVRLPNIIYGGNHGLEGEIFGEKYSFPIPKNMLTALKNIRKQLNRIKGQIQETYIEDKKLSLSVHYRQVDKDLLPKVQLMLKEILELYVKKGLISIVKGRRVIEISPKVNWNKGNFAKMIFNRISKQAKIKPAVIFIGDCTTDEDIFRKFKNDITIKVGPDTLSSAKYGLGNIGEVFAFLEWLSDIVY